MKKILSYKKKKKKMFITLLLFKKKTYYILCFKTLTLYPQPLTIY